MMTFVLLALTGLEKIFFKLCRAVRIVDAKRCRIAKSRHHMARLAFKRIFALPRKRGKRIFIDISADRGIGNRMKAIVSNIVYFETNKIFVRWPTHGWVTAPFKELFSTTSDLLVEEIDDLSFSPDFSQSAPVALSKGLWNEIGGGGVIFYPPQDELAIREGAPFNLCETTRRRYSEVFKKFKPSRSVLQRMNDISLPASFISVQIRRNKDWIEYGREDPVNYYIEEMKKFPDDTIFFLSAMNKETADEIRATFGTRITELPHKNYSSMTDAVADMFILAKGEKGLYPYGSTFWETAWWLGGARQPVTIVGSDNIWQAAKKLGLRPFLYVQNLNISDKK